MKITLLELDYARLIGGGLIIPPYVMGDSIIGFDYTQIFSQILHMHIVYHGEIHFPCVGDNASDSEVIEFFDDCFDYLRVNNYIILKSKQVKKDEVNYFLQLHPWYLQYIETNPCYDPNYQIKYREFLKTEILPTITDKILFEQLSNQILDQIIEDEDLEL